MSSIKCEYCGEWNRVRKDMNKDEEFIYCEYCERFFLNPFYKNEKEKRL